MSEPRKSQWNLRSVFTEQDADCIKNVLELSAVALGNGSSGEVHPASCVSSRAPHDGYLGLSVRHTYAVKTISRASLARHPGKWERVKAELDVLRLIQTHPPSESQGSKSEDADQSQNNDSHSDSDSDTNSHWSGSCQSHSSEKKRLFVELCHALYDDVRVYMVMESVEGGTLAQRVTGKRVFSERDALVVTRQLLRALEFLHVEMRYAHLDLKPENVMFVSKPLTSAELEMSCEEEGAHLTIKLIDFGFAQSLTPSTTDARVQGRACSSYFHYYEPSPSDTLAIVPRGTPHYMAPEMLQYYACHEQSGGRQPCARRVHRTHAEDAQRLDVFSLGVLVYFMLSGGARPFVGTTHRELLRNILLHSCVRLPGRDGSAAAAEAFCAALLRVERGDGELPRPRVSECWALRWMGGKEGRGGTSSLNAMEVERGGGDGAAA